ncbi:Cell division control protein 48 -like protein C [Capsicum annuum]|uniref:Cell division control protein 48 -like protein C n=1 Tax=Capsicum annuum TaxID=4072 RepID=A0A2G2YBV2_CAPAN|nr:Cell division control protein 48 -like protein C [Capsicum annuum]
MFSKGGGRRNGVTRDLKGGVREGERFGGSDGSVDGPRILFHGLPGCHKTKLAHAIADETRVPFYKLSAIELVSGVSGASEKNIRELFSKAYRTAPSIMFIDEIDAIASKTENLQKEMEQHIVKQLLTCMDESHRVVKPNDAEASALPSDKRNSEAKSDGSNRGPGYVLVIGADREIALGIPDENARPQILSVLTRNLRVEGAFDVMKIASSTPGFVGADLAALTNKEGNLAMKRITDMRKVELLGESEDGEDAEEWWRKPWSPEEMANLSINMADFERYMFVLLNLEDSVSAFFGTALSWYISTVNAISPVARNVLCLCLFDEVE